MTTTQTTPSTASSTTGITRSGPALAADDPRAVFARAVAVGASVVGAVRPDQMDGPTPCDDFDVRQLMGHMVAVLGRVAAIGRGEPPMSVPSTVEVADDEWSAAWSAAAREIETAWSDTGRLTQLVRLPWAEMSGAAALAMYTNEITVHTWDMASATGQRPAWDPSVLAVAFDAVRQALPAKGRKEILEAAIRAMPATAGRVSLPFAELVPVADDAPLIDRLVAWTGRRPATV